MWWTVCVSPKDLYICTCVAVLLLRYPEFWNWSVIYGLAGTHGYLDVTYLLMGGHMSHRSPIVVLCSSLFGFS